MVKDEAFLDLENSLVSAINPLWLALYAKLSPKLIKAVRSNDFIEVQSLLETIKPTSFYSGKIKKINLLFEIGLLFGASRVTNKANSLHIQSYPEHMEIAALSFDQFEVVIEDLVFTLKNNLNDSLLKIRERLDFEEERKKSDTVSVVKINPINVPNAVLTKGSRVGTNLINIASSLQMSRLSAYGFSAEAHLRGITTYVVNEQLDSRTCPVCRRMHGREFKVKDALRKLDALIRLTEPDDFRQLAPWPKQDAESLKELETATSEELRAKGFDTPPYHPMCYAEGTEVYTREGFVLFKDVKVGDEFLSLNPETLDTEWVSAIDTQDYSYTGDMYRFYKKNNSLNLLVTPEHSQFVLRRVDRGYSGRELVPEFLNAEEVGGRPEQYIYHSSNSTGKNSLVTIAGWSFNRDSFCSFMGWYLSEGHTTKRPYGYESCITQYKNTSELESCLDCAGLTYKKHSGGKYYLTGNNNLNEWLYGFGKSFEKFIPTQVLESDPKNLRTFLDSYILGDGCTRIRVFDGYETTSKSIATSSYKMAGQLVEVCVRAGYAASLSTSSEKGTKLTHRNGTYYSNHNCYNIAVKTSKTSMPRVDIVPYSGRVYDVTLERNHTLLVKYGSSICWSGNCRGLLKAKPNARKLQSVKEFPNLSGIDTLQSVNPRVADFLDSITGLNISLSDREAIIAASIGITDFQKIPLVLRTLIEENETN